MVSRICGSFDVVHSVLSMESVTVYIVFSCTRRIYCHLTFLLLLLYRGVVVYGVTTRKNPNKTELGNKRLGVEN